MLRLMWLKIALNFKSDLMLFKVNLNLPKSSNRFNVVFKS